MTPLLPNSTSTHSHLSTTTTLAPSSPAAAVSSTAKGLLAKVQSTPVVPTLYAPETLFDAGLVLSTKSAEVAIKVRRAGETEWRKVEIVNEVGLGKDGWVKVELELEEEEEVAQAKSDWEVWVGEKKMKGQVAA